jgi:hypothetical protein
MSKLFWVVWCAAIVFFLATMWRVFEKAGKPGWASLIPIYNGLVMLDMAGKPRWWFFLYLIPLVNIVVAFKVVIEIAHRFGKSTAFGIGLALLGFIFFPILAFGDAAYTPAT